MDNTGTIIRALLVNEIQLHSATELKIPTPTSTSWWQTLINLANTLISELASFVSSDLIIAQNFAGLYVLQRVIKAGFKNILN